MRTSQMQSKEQLIQEIEQAPESLIEEVLNYLLFTKSRQTQTRVASQSDSTVQDRLTGLFADDSEQMETVMQSIEDDRIRDRQESLG